MGKLFFALFALSLFALSCKNDCQKINVIFQDSTNKTFCKEELVFDSLEIGYLPIGVIENGITQPFNQRAIGVLSAQ